jgi:hypothetical protein
VENGNITHVECIDEYNPKIHLITKIPEKKEVQQEE